MNFFQRLLLAAMGPNPTTNNPTYGGGFNKLDPSRKVMVPQPKPSTPLSPALQGLQLQSMGGLPTPTPRPPIPGMNPMVTTAESFRLPTPSASAAPSIPRPTPPPVVPQGPQEPTPSQGPSNVPATAGIDPSMLGGASEAPQAPPAPLPSQPLGPGTPQMAISSAPTANPALFQQPGSPDLVHLIGKLIHKIPH